MEKYHGKSTEQIIQKLMPGSVKIECRYGMGSY